MALEPGLSGLKKKAFVCDVDTHLGRLVCQKLGKEYELSGTTTTDSDEPQKWVSTLVKRDQAKLLKQTLLESDLVIYQLLGQENVVDATAAIKTLMNSHYEVEKTLVLVSSVMTWFETQTAQEKEEEEERAAAAAEDEEGGGEPEEPEEKEQPTYSEGDFNKRVPHVKYQDWKDVEKLCKRANSKTLHTYCIYAGLQYGMGEDKLHPIFKQAWHLRSEGLPRFGEGKNVVPMIHVEDLANFVIKLPAEQDPDDPQRYFFGCDDGNCSWNDVIKAINAPGPKDYKHSYESPGEVGMGTGKINQVRPRDFVLYENVEHFIINLKLADDGKIGGVLGDDWKYRSGFVENIGKVIGEYKEVRQTTPLRVCVVGPPASGKTYYARQLAAKYKLPHITIADVIQEYKNQVLELRDAIDDIKRQKREDKIREKLKKLREEMKEKKKAEAEAEGGEGGGDAADADPDEEEDEFGDDPDFLFDDELEQELKKEPAEGEEDDEEDADEERANRKKDMEERLNEVNMVLNLKEKEKKEDDGEPPDPKKKAKPAPKGKPGKEPAAAPAEDDEKPKPPPRYTPKALAYMVQWRLRNPNCRNPGFVLDGYPRTVKEARFLFEEGLPGAVPEEPTEEDDEPPALEPGQQNKVDELFFPDNVVTLKASDTFLTERVQKIQDQGHNAPEDFQRRLEAYKVNNPPRDRVEPPKDADKGLTAWLESALSNRMRKEGDKETDDPREVCVQQFDVDRCPLTPLPPPTSLTEEAEREKVVDEVFAAITSFVGDPHNYGPSPQEIAEEEERQRRIEEEKEEEQQRLERERQERERNERNSRDAERQKEEDRLASMKQEEKEMLEIRKEPLKEYLMSNIIPVLTKGLIEVCEQRPEDPIDYLAEWLFHHNPVEDQDI